MFQFFGILIEVKYLQDSLPFPTLPLNFWRFGGTGRFDRVSCYFLLSFWWVVLFSSTTSPWSTSVFFFSNSTISTRYISKSSKHSSEVLYMKPFLSFLGNTSLVFHQNHQIYCRQHVCRLFIFLKCGSSFTSIWWISFDEINIYFEKVGIFIRWSNWFPGYIFITSHNCHHMLTFCLNFFSNRNKNMMVRLRRYGNWYGTFLLMLSFSPKITHLPVLFCHSKYLLLTISFVYNGPQTFLVYCEAKDNHAEMDYMIDVDYLISRFWVCS